MSDFDQFSMLFIPQENHWGSLKSVIHHSDEIRTDFKPYRPLRRTQQFTEINNPFSSMNLELLQLEKGSKVNVPIAGKTCYEFICGIDK